MVKTHDQDLLVGLWEVFSQWPCVEYLLSLSVILLPSNYESFQEYVVIKSIFAL